MGNFEPPNLIFGFILGYVILWIFFKRSKSYKYFKQFPLVLEFIFFLLWEILISNIRLTITILSPKLKLQPGVVAVPLDLKSDLGIVILAHLITLTPGSLSLDISSHKKYLYVHVVNLEDPDLFIKEVKDKFERRVREILE